MYVVYVTLYYADIVFCEVSIIYSTMKQNRCFFRDFYNYSKKIVEKSNICTIYGIFIIFSIYYLNFYIVNSILTYIHHI